MKDRGSDSIAYAIVFQLGLGFISFFAALGFGKFVLPSSGELVLRFILSCFLWAGTTVFSFKAIKSLSAGELTILSSGSSVISIVLGIVFLKEAFSINIALGAFLILLSILIVNSERVSFNSKVGIFFGLLSAVCAGFAVASDAFILRDYDAFSYTAIISLFPGVILMILFPKKIAKAKALLNLKSIKFMSIFCLFTYIQAITYYLAFQAGAPVSQLAPFIKSSSVLTVILGAIFLNERRHFYRIMAASIIVTFGAILLG